MSVCPSFRPVLVLYHKQLYTVSNFLTISMAIILAFKPKRCYKISRVTPQRARCGTKNSAFSTNIADYFGDSMRQAHSYYRSPAGSHRYPIKLCHFLITFGDLEDGSSFSGGYIFAYRCRLIKFGVLTHEGGASFQGVPTLTF